VTSGSTPGDTFRDLERTHPIAAEIATLAHHHAQAKEYSEAEPLYKYALEITQAAVGRQHPAVATILEHYAEVLRAVQREGAAEELETRARAIHDGVGSAPPREYWLG
jgi:hypothetical protein